MDYTYNFDTRHSKKTGITIQNDCFRWPQFDENADTVFLKLNVSQKGLKGFGLPYLKVSFNNQSVKQHLERNNSGIRYFNLSFLLDSVKAGNTIRLDSNKLEWTENAELIFFRNDKAEKKQRVLVISPHPDDAELAAFGFYSHHDAYIVTITAGESGKTFYHDYYPRNLIRQNRLKAKLRIFDSLFVPYLGNVPPDKTVNLGYFDNTLRDMYQQPDKAVVSSGTNLNNINPFRAYNISHLPPEHDGKATRQNLINDLTAIISEISPDIIVLPHPTLDKNSDHRYATIATLTAVKSANKLKGHYYFYINHSAYSSRYPYGDQDSPITLPPNFNEFGTPCFVYSFPMSNDSRILKSFALDAMHDLRHLPNYRPKISHFLMKKYRHLFAWRDYFRKAIRLNELFVVLSMEKTDNLLEELSVILK